MARPKELTNPIKITIWVEKNDHDKLKAYADANDGVYQKQYRKAIYEYIMKLPDLKLGDKNAKRYKGGSV